jgi:putative transposase
MQTFFSDEDYGAYIGLLRQGCRAAGVEVWGYCLMPNHVHLILVPADELGLRTALAETHRRYSSHINRREGWSGYLWQGRFASFPMDEKHLLACARYVELNPVRAGLVRQAEQWPWSSARAHLGRKDDRLVSVQPLLDRVDNWSEFLSAGLDDGDRDAIRASERTGRPLCTADFLRTLEEGLGRPLAKQKRGPRRISGTQY